jgi:hypothetical protein
MGLYKATSTDSRNFNLTIDTVPLGKLEYPKWYTFKADILLADHSKYQLEPKGFWDWKIELKQNEKSLLNFKMGWKGIIINTEFDGDEKSYLLSLKGLLSSKYVLIDTDENELLVVESDFKWNKLHFDYTITTSDGFDSHNNKELLLLTILHCINYYLTVTAVGM